MEITFFLACLPKALGLVLTDKAINLTMSFKISGGLSWY